MKKIVIFTVLLFFSRPSFAVVEEVEVRKDGKIDTIEDITAHLEEKVKKEQPFDEKDVKIDLESLGLDDMEDDALKAVAGDGVAVFDPSKEKKVVKFEEEGAKKTVTVKVVKEGKVVKLGKKSEVAAKDDGSEVKDGDGGVKDVKKIDSNESLPLILNDPIVKSDSREEALESSEKKGFLSKIQNFITNSDEEVGGKKEKEDVALQDVVKGDLQKAAKEAQEKKRLELRKKKAREKKDRLNKLRALYLSNLIKAGGEDFSFEQGLIQPRKKDLDWSDRFASYDAPPPPIMQPFRGEQNAHIPQVIRGRQRVDVMFDAIAAKNVAAFNQAYRYVVNPDVYNKVGDTILTNALILRQYAIVLSILQKGADPDLPNRLGHTPLDIAIDLLDLKSAKILLDMNVDINYTDIHNETYLMHAVRTGYLPMVRLFVERGADINARDDRNRSALFIARRRKKEIIATYLLKRGAKIWPEKFGAPKVKRKSLIKELENRWK